MTMNLFNATYKKVHRQDAPQLVCVIIKNRTAQSVIDLYNRIGSYKTFDSFIIVDNHTSSASYAKLMQCAGPITHVMTTDRTGSSGYLVNTGLRYAASLRAKHVLLLEENVLLEEETVTRLLEFMESHPDAIFCGPRWEGQESARRLPSAKACLTYCSPAMDKVFRSASYHKKRFDASHLYATAQIIQSGMVMIDMDHFLKLGLFDESPDFLFKELAAGHMARLYGFKSYVLTTCSCSLPEEEKQESRIQKYNVPASQRVSSMVYYLEHYMNNPKAALACKMLTPFYQLEGLMESIMYGEEPVSEDAEEQEISYEELAQYPQNFEIELEQNNRFFSPIKNSVLDWSRRSVDQIRQNLEILEEKAGVKFHPRKLKKQSR